MASAGTALIEFEGDFSKVALDARRYGERAGGLFGSEFGDRSDKAIGSSFRGTTKEMGRDAERAGSRAGGDYGSEFGRKAERSMGGVFKKIAAGATAVFAGTKVVSLFGDMISEGREAAKVSRITDNAIKQTGGVAHVTAGEVGDLSTALSNKAGIDDELIQTGANLLLTFKNVRNELGADNDIFDRAVTAATDLSVQFGSVDSASKMLGKALNDPIKGMAALGRAGVTFSDDQKATVAALVGANDVLGAQKIILGEVESQVGGAAAAAADPLDRLTVAWGNLLELGGSKILPWAGDVADGLVDRLPGAIDTVQTSVEGLVSKGTDLAQSLWSQVEPAASDVVDTLGHLYDIGKDVVEIGAPLAKALGLAGGAAVLGTLRLTAAGLETISGFLARNEKLVQGLTLALIGLAAVKTVSALSTAFDTLSVKAFDAFGAINHGAVTASTGGALSSVKLIGSGIGDMTANLLTVPEASERMASGFSAGVGKVKTGAVGLAKSLATPQAAIAGIAIGITSALEEISSATADARAEVESLKPKNFDEGDLDSLTKYSDALHVSEAAAAEADKKHDGLWNTIRAGVEVVLPGVESGAYNSARALTALGDAADDVGGQTFAMKATLREIGRLLGGLDTSQVQDWLELFDLDPLAASQADVAAEIKSNLIDLAQDAGLQGTQIKDALELSPDEIKAQKAQWEELSKAVSGAWTGQLDLIGAFSGREMGAEVADGVKEIRSGVQVTVAGIRSDLADTLKDLSGPERTKAIEDAQARIDEALGKGKQAVTDYTNEHAVSSPQIEKWYTDQAAQATTFAQNIGTAMQQGYDPALVSRLLQAGPAQAAPILEAMVADHSGRLQEIVNEGEKALTALSTLAVEMARLQNLAMNSESDDMVKHLGDAMKEAEAVSRLGAGATAQAVADELGVGVWKVLAIADQYGIGLADAVNPVLSAVGKPLISLGASASPGARNAEQQNRNAGGPIFGPNVDRDVVPAMLTPGEFVIRKSMVDKWGPGAMAALNMGRTPVGWSVPGALHFNAGGGVPAPPGIGSWPLAQGGEGAMGMSYRAVLGLNGGGRVATPAIDWRALLPAVTAAAAAPTPPAGPPVENHFYGVADGEERLSMRRDFEKSLRG